MQHALGKEKPEFPKPNEAMIDQVISIVEDSTTEDLIKPMTYYATGTLPSLCWTLHTLSKPTKIEIAMEMQFVQLCAT